MKLHNKKAIVTGANRSIGKAIAMAFAKQRAGIPDDQANAALFLASEESSWMTGQIMTIDGGQSLSF